MILKLIENFLDVLEVGIVARCADHRVVPHSVQAGDGAQLGKASIRAYTASPLTQL